MNKTEYLLSMLMELPPKLEDIEKELKTDAYTTEEVTLAACKFTEQCFLECRDFEEAFGRKPQKEEVHSAFVYDICELLLKHGLDANLFIEDTNLMYELRYVDYNYISAETMRLLLENGGNVNIDDGDEPMFQHLDYDVMFDASYRTVGKDLFDKEFKLWILMIGYGGVIKENETPVKIADGYSVEQFKDYENFTYEIEFSGKDSVMHIIDIRTNKEVAWM